MSQRERSTSRGHPANGTAAAAPRPGEPPAWDDLFTLLPVAQRDRLLALAADRGTLDARVIPEPAPDATRGLLTRLLAGDLPDDLPTPDLIDCDDLPADLDAQQRRAVAAALATPDLFLIQGLPGTGKSRVAAAVIAAAARRGRRVLLLAPHPAALDRALELIGDDPAVCALRCPGRDESEAALHPAAARCTFAAHARACEQSRQRADAQFAEASQRCRRREADAVVYDQLADVAEQCQRLEARRAELADRLARVPDESAAALAQTPEAADHAAELARLDADRQARRAAADLARQNARALDAPLAELRQLATARETGHWWNRTWWQARSAGDIDQRLAELESQQRQAETEADTATADADRLDRGRDDRDAVYQRDHAERLRVEVEGRKADLNDQAAALEREQAVLTDKWQQAVRQLAPDSPPLESATPAVVAAARAAWQPLHDGDRRQCEFALAWAEGLTALAADLPGRLLGAVNLVAATPAGLAADRHFGDPRRGLFDLLVIDEAHELTEAELSAATRRARRWVLIGEPADRFAGNPKADIRSPNKGRVGASKPRPTGRGAFHRLWQTLHCEPWGREDGRLVCRLRPVPAERRAELESEAVADRPDVELRILTPPGGVPQLAEVVFPPGATLAPAKEYVFQQLGEAPIPAGLSAPGWRDEPAHVACDLHAGLATVVATLTEGVREHVAKQPGGWTTCSLEFDRAAGWDRARAETWVREHVGRHGPSRTARLDTLHRMAPALASVIADLLGTDSYETSADGDGTVRVEFVPVPPLADGRRNGHAPAPPRLPPDPRGGAGLEIDLSDGRQRTRLPAGLSAVLPERGLVNPAEAEAVVRLLARLTADGTPGPIAVLALFAAQAELIRHLARSVPGLPADLVIDVPPALRQREASTVIVSLTRSHTHRAVFYGDEPDWLPLALARGREKLILVGDPGTLARRAQWDGPLDHLDAVAARRERDLAHHLIRYLHGRGRHARTVRLLEGPPP